MRATPAGGSLVSASAFPRVLAGDSGVPAARPVDLVVTVDVVAVVVVEVVGTVVVVDVVALQLP